jgi:hypothetical protein
MTEQRNDGGPAFPVSTQGKGEVCGPYGHQDSTATWQFPGLTIRDYFAAKAMQALVASNDEGAGDRLTDIPAYAYDIADAMLKAREQ